MDTLVCLKKEICKTGTSLYNKGLSTGISGNISIKFNDNILITPSGCCLGDMEEHDIAVIDVYGNHLEGQKPSSEKIMHLEIYKLRPDLKAVVHVHSPKATAFAVAGVPLNRPTLAELIVTLGDVPVAEYATPSSLELAKIVAGYFVNNDNVLMANHGFVSGGKNLKEALYKVETLESYAEIMLWTKVLGNANELSKESIEELIKIREKMHK